MPIRLVLFDLDNTLYDGKGFARHVIFGDLRNCLKARRERGARRALAGRDFDSQDDLQKALAHIVARGGDERATQRWYASGCLDNMVRVLQRHYTARPGTAEAIAELLRRGVQVGVLSDYPRTRERLQALGLGHLDLPTWSCEELGSLKPSPRPFLRVAQALHLEPGEIMVVGDKADADAAAALKAGCHCLLVKGKHSDNLLGVEALEWPDLLRRLTMLGEE